MIKIDNFKLIKDFLVFPESDTYFYLQVLQRRKGMTKQRYSNLIVNRDFDEDIIEYYCKMFTARAYISVIPRSLKKFTVELSKAVLNRVFNESYVTSTFRLPDSIALSKKTVISGYNLWMFDIDDPDMKDIVLEECKLCKIDVKVVIPSFKGYHIIVKPFNPTGFKYESLIKKESNTLLFGYEY